jgi:hypothetical protein
VRCLIEFAISVYILLARSGNWPPGMKNRARPLLLLSLLMGALFLLFASLSPIARSRVGLVSSYPPNQSGISAGHRVEHWVIFGILALLCTVLCRRVLHRIGALAAVISLGVVIELLQHVVYSIPVETWDIRDDCEGAFVGFLAAILLLIVKGRQAARARSNSI